MKRSYSTSLKKSGGDASDKWNKRWANKRVRKIANDLSLEEKVIGKPSSRVIKKLYIIESREYITRHSLWADDYLKKGKKLPFWTNWKRYKSFEKRGARDREFEVIQSNKGWAKKYSIGLFNADSEYRKTDLK